MQNGPMDVFRFDRDIAMSLVDGDPRAQVGQLIGNASKTRAEILYLDEGSSWSPSRSELSHLFAVITGSCVVNAAEREPIVLQALQAIVAEEEEQWTLFAPESVVGLWIEGEFDVWAVEITKDIVVTQYDEAWPSFFDQICQEVWPHVQDVALRIDHVGSTAVLGLAAKPVIDVDIVLAKRDDVAELIERLKRVGYRWRGDLGVTGREAFSYLGETELPSHHLYVVVENNRAHLDHLLLRDLLREHATAREQYADLKIQNAELANDNMDTYVAAKAHFVAELLTRARMERGLTPVEYWNPA